MPFPVCCAGKVGETMIIFHTSGRILRVCTRCHAEGTLG